MITCMPFSYEVPVCFISVIFMIVIVVQKEGQRTMEPKESFHNFKSAFVVKSRRRSNMNTKRGASNPSSRALLWLSQLPTVRHITPLVP